MTGIATCGRSRDEPPAKELAHAYIHNVYFLVRFVWHPEKSERNFVERGFDFAFATLAFAGRLTSASILARTTVRYDGLLSD